MTRILFVDDEPKVLDALQQLLRRQRRPWETVFVDSGEKAIDLLNHSAFDIIVSDIVMPQISGTAVLQAAQRLQPQAVRIVLSGAAEQQGALKAVAVAHQFLIKPCDPQTFDSTLERACQIHALIKDPELQRAIGKVQKLPTMPGTWTRLKKVMDSPISNASQVAAVLQQDVAICARVLQLVNSPFFGPARRIAALEDAVTYLGNNLIRNLVFSLELFSVGAPSPWFPMDAMRRHTLLAASIARRIVPERRLADEAFFAAMLHDVGLLVLASQPESSEDPTLHPRIGGYLLSLWGMDATLVSAVQDHHTPARLATGRFGVGTAVHVADVLATRLVPFEGCPFIDFDWEHLDQLGVTDRIPAWEGVAQEALSGMGAFG